MRSNSIAALVMLLVLLALPSAAAWSVRERFAPEWGFWPLTLSLISFFSYAFDKRRAERGGRRVPEPQLLLVDLLGGWPGGWLGQRVFRHKTAKVGYRAAFWLIVALYEATATWLLWR